MQTSLEGSSQQDVSEDSYDNNSIISCTYSGASISSRQEKHGVNGLNFRIRDAISRDIIHLATTNGISEELSNGKEMIYDGAKRSRETKKEKGMKKNCNHEFDKRNPKVVQFENEPRCSKMDNVQKRGIVRGFTRKGRSPSMASQPGLQDLCINAKKVEVKRYEHSQKQRNGYRGPSHLSVEPLEKKSRDTGIIMQENVIANASFDGDVDEDLLHSDELLLFSSRNGEHASIRDNVVFQSGDMQSTYKDEQTVKSSTQLVTLRDKEETDHYVDCLRDTIATEIISPKSSIDHSDSLSKKHPMVKMDDVISASWNRRSYELGEKLLNDVQQENMESSCFELRWYESQQGINELSFPNRKSTLSCSMDNFRAKFGDCTPLDLEKIEIEEPSNFLFPDLNMLDTLNISMDGPDSNMIAMEEEENNNLNIVCLQNNPIHDLADSNSKDSGRTWSTSIDQDCRNTEPKHAHNMENSFESPGQNSLSRPLSSSLQYIPRHRIDPQQTLQKAVLKDVSLRVTRHQRVAEPKERNESSGYELVKSTSLQNKPLQSCSDSRKSTSCAQNNSLAASSGNEKIDKSLSIETLPGTSISKKYFDSCEDFRNSETLQVLTVVAGGCSFTSTDYKNQNDRTCSRKAESEDRAFCSSPITSQNYDKLIQDLTHKYSSEDAKQSDQLQLEAPNARDELEHTQEKLENSSSTTLALIPSHYVTDLRSSSSFTKLSAHEKKEVRQRHIGHQLIYLFSSTPMVASYYKW